MLEEFAERASGSGDTGSLDGPDSSRRSSNGCSAPTRRPSSGSSISWRSSTSTRCAATAMRRRTSSGSSTMRLEVGELRRALAAHRPALVSLSPSRARGARGPTSRASVSESLLGRFEVDVAGGTRRARGDRRLVRRPDRPRRSPNERDHEGADADLRDPAARRLLAGVMGMNFKVGLFDEPASSGSCSR